MSRRYEAEEEVRMKYFREAVARKLLVNKEFNSRYCRVLRTLVVIYESGVDAFWQTRSAESQYWFEEKRRQGSAWCIRELCRLNTEFSFGKSGFLRYLDKTDIEVREQVLIQFYEMSLNLLDQLNL